MAKLGISFLLSLVILAGHIDLGVPKINVLSGEYVRVKNAPE